MIDDDIMPNDGTYYMPREPLDQAVERKKERALALEGMDFLEAMVTRLDERIAFYESNSSIGDDVRTDPAQFLILHNSYTLMAKTLKNERDMLQSVIDSYKKK